MLLNKTAGDLSGNRKIKGKVVLMKKNVLDGKDLIGSSLVDDFQYESFGQKVTLQLIGADHGDGENGGKVGKPAYLENWAVTGLDLAPGETACCVDFEWVESFGVPVALIIRNYDHSEFYLKSVTIEDVPDNGRVQFVCNSWVYPVNKYKKDRVFCVNQAYRPSETPDALRKYREEELVALRGDGTGELKEWDRVYDYALYNDLGDPDKSADYARPVLGGSTEYPYPRRGRSGRPPTKSDPNSESRLPLIASLNIYVPRDEKFGLMKLTDFLYYGLKSVIQIVHEIPIINHGTFNEFDSFEEILELYDKGIKLPGGDLLKNISDGLSSELFKDHFRNYGEGFSKFPNPAVIKEDKSAWRTDEEFGREMLAGVNPIIISRLQEFPPKSKLDPKLYGNQNSTITRQQIENNLDGLTIDQALNTNRLYILDHHDMLMPYARKINTTNTKIYASRTLLFLQKDGTLKPLAIELSLPHPNGDASGAVSEVYLPANEGTVEGSLWQLANAYVAMNDSGVHQLISHWLRTHATIEPFVIATNRQLSVLHPIYKLLGS